MRESSKEFARKAISIRNGKAGEVEVREMEMEMPACIIIVYSEI